MDNMEPKTAEAIDFPADTVPAIVVDDGMERVPIRNKFGNEIGVFFCRPTDLGIVDRYNDFVAGFDKITAPLKNSNIKNDGTASEDDQTSLDALKEAESRLSDALNVLFGGNFAEAFFGRIHPFSPVGGRFYCEHAIDAVGQYINTRFDSELKRSEDRIAKYTRGYQTGKHRNGRRRNRGGHRA